MFQPSSRLIPFVIAALLAFGSVPAVAQSAYPSKPVKLVVPFPAGTGADGLARLLAESLAASMSVPVTVENVTGASGTIGVDRVAKAAPDGYTLVLCGDTALIMKGSYGVNPPYDTLKDLAPIAQVAVTPNILVVANDVPAKTVQELITVVRSQPGRFNYASVGNGTSQHRGGELLNSMAGLDMVHVPVSGNPMLDVIGGRVQIYFASILNLPLIREGKVRALAVSSLVRTPAAPDLPTLAESGLPGFEAVAWYGLLAPSGTPRQVLDRLETETRKALASPAVTARLQTLGSVPTAPSAAALTRVIRDETLLWATRASAAQGKQP